MTTSNSMRYRCNCGGRLYVCETRAAEDAIYRVRKCANCTYLFTTKEVAIEGTLPKYARALTQRKPNELRLPDKRRTDSAREKPAAANLTGTAAS
jgi:transcriptional regulator NrdR family protein